MFIRNTAQILILVNMHHPHLCLVLYELTQDEKKKITNNVENLKHYLITTFPSCILPSYEALPSFHFVLDLKGNEREKKKERHITLLNCHFG